MAQSMDDARLDEQLFDLYKYYRNALYNREYYGCRLAYYRRLNRRLEIGVAIGTSSAIGSWVIWKDGAGETVWAVVAALTTIVAIIKPILDLPKQIERYSKLFVGHGDVYYDFEQLVLEVKQAGRFTDEISSAFMKVLQRRKALAPDDDPTTDKKLEQECQDVVNKKIPVTSLWMPESSE